MAHPDLSQLRDRDRNVLGRIVDVYVCTGENPFFVVKHNDGLVLEVDGGATSVADAPTHVELSAPRDEMSLDRLTALGLIEWTANQQYCEPSVTAVELVGPGRPILADGAHVADELRTCASEWDQLRDTRQVDDFGDDLLGALDDIREELCRIADALEAMPESYAEWLRQSQQVSRDATELRGASKVLKVLAGTSQVASWLNLIHELVSKLPDAIGA